MWTGRFDSRPCPRRSNTSGRVIRPLRPGSEAGNPRLAQVGVKEGSAISQPLRSSSSRAGPLFFEHSKILHMIDETHQTWSNIVDAIRRAEISSNKTGGRQRLNVNLRNNGIGITQPGTSREIRVELSGQRLEVEQSLGESEGGGEVSYRIVQDHIESMDRSTSWSVESFVREVVLQDLVQP